LNGSFSR